MKVTILPVSFVLLAFFWFTQGANILLLTPMGSESHKIFYMGIVEALAERGHEITVVSGYKNKKEIKNVKDVVVHTGEVTQLLSNVFEEDGAQQLIKDLILETPRICNEGLASQEVQDLKKNKYDIVLLSTFFSHCYLSLVHHFKVPFVYITPVGLNVLWSSMIRNFDVPSIAGSMTLQGSFPLTFYQRFKVILVNTLLSGMDYFFMVPEMESVCRARGLCPPDVPSFYSFDGNASFAIINRFRTLERPSRPSLPNIIYAGGAHLRSGKPLSQEIENFIQSSGDAGFIFFSLGSAVKPSTLPEKYRKVLVNVFGKLKQQVLWKWDEQTMPDLPQNVKLGKWLPQQDILAHKKIRMFITHGGLLSTMEASYNGVPVLGLPIFADQFFNMKEAVTEGWAQVLSWNNLNEEKLNSMINEILTNDSLRELSKRRSSIMKDRQVHPADEAAYWIEYTLRHKGAEHLRSPLFQLSWYELHNIDVWGLIVLLILLIVCIFFIISRAILRFCFGVGKGRISTKTNKKKEQRIW